MIMQDHIKIGSVEMPLEELDKWIHKHVFEADLHVGIKKRGFWYRPDAKGYTSDQDEAGRYTRAEAKEHEYLHDDPVTIHEFEPKRYSTNPAAAMEVLKKCVERLENDRAYPAIQKYHDLDGFQGWQVCALYETRNQRTFSAVAKTLELAIALFGDLYTTLP